MTSTSSRKPSARSAPRTSEGRNLGTWRVVAGTVRWGDIWSAPVIMRPIGYGRNIKPGEPPSFVVSAFFLYPSALGLMFPWNERIATSEDRFIGALWRGKGVEVLFAPDARAVHDDEHNEYGVEHQAYHIYANLFDALIANRSLTRALCYEFLGFAAGAKKYFLREPGSAAAYLAAWYCGHRSLIRDWPYLKELLERELPPRSLNIREPAAGPPEMPRCGELTAPWNSEEAVG